MAMKEHWGELLCVWKGEGISTKARWVLNEKTVLQHVYFSVASLIIACTHTWLSFQYIVFILFADPWPSSPYRSWEFWYPSCAGNNCCYKNINYLDDVWGKVCFNVWCHICLKVYTSYWKSGGGGGVQPTWEFFYGPVSPIWICRYLFLFWNPRQDHDRSISDRHSYSRWSLKPKVLTNSSNRP